MFIGANGATLGRDVTHTSAKQRDGLLYVPNDESISRNHCAITFNAERQVFVIRDLGSSNNTYVISGPGAAPTKISETTGQPTKGTGQTLKQGDIIQVRSNI
jgi:pSer/pThr/pTyr-binding forkhead associated (FHA) protein